MLLYAFGVEVIRFQPASLSKALGALVLGMAFAAPAAAQDVPIDRTVLPIGQPTYPPVTELDARNATPPPFFQAKAPAAAPNVLIVLIDDMGFGQSSAFGGPVHMPTAEGLANQGLQLQRVPHNRAVLANAGGLAHRP